jgi:hypothetical protein
MWISCSSSQSTLVVTGHMRVPEQQQVIAAVMVAALLKQLA